MFDKAEIQVKAGNGGDGSVSFHREKFVPFGGPDGGDGGRGGNVVLKADTAIDDLRRYRQKRKYSAVNGQHGRDNRKHGKNGEDLVLPVPVGTIVKTISDEGDETELADLASRGDEVIVAHGGRGGWANVHFASSTNQAPHIAQRGYDGDNRIIRLEMRLIADVGIIGYPNAGKSTLLTAASAAHPKIADYPFTTIEPVLGVVDTDAGSFVMAEIPGLIQGAHAGRGLGHEFLRHAVRTRMFIHLVSGDAPSVLEEIEQVNREVTLYDHTMAEKSQVVAVNKIDVAEVKERAAELKRELNGAGIKPYMISAATGEGVGELMAAVMETLREIANAQLRETEQPAKTFRPRPREDRFTVRKEEDGYIADVPELERIYAAAGCGPGEIRQQIIYQLKRMGAYKALEKAGIKPGDKVRCGDVTWEW